MKNETIISAMTVAGLTLIWPLFKANRFGDLLLFGVANDSVAVVLHIILFVCCLLIAAIAQFKSAWLRNLPFRDDKMRCLFFGVLASLGCYGVIAAYNIDWISKVLIPFGVLLWTSGLLSLFVAWGDVLRAMPCRRMIITIAVSFFLGSLLFQLCASLFLVDVDDRLIAPSFVALSALICYFCPVPEKDASTLNFQIDKMRLVRAIRIVIFFALLASLVRGYAFATSNAPGYHPADLLLYNWYDLIFTFVVMFLAALEKNLIRFLSYLWVAFVSLFALGLFLVITVPDQFEMVIQALLVVISSQLLCYFFVVIALAMRKENISPLALFNLYTAVQVVVGLISYYLMPFLVDSFGTSLVPIVVFCFMFLVFAVAGHYRDLLIRDRFGDESAADEPITLQAPAEDNRKALCAMVRRQYRLTEREEEVLNLLASGRSRKAIAEKLFVTENTVGAHIKSIYSKTGCHKKDDVIRLLERLKAGELEKAGHSRS